VEPLLAVQLDKAQEERSRGLQRVLPRPAFLRSDVRSIRMFLPVLKRNGISFFVPFRTLNENTMQVTLTTLITRN
jgi:hypothetical protein